MSLYLSTSYLSKNILVPTECHWGDFGDWTGCSKDCGGGRRSRFRTRVRVNMIESLSDNDDCKGYDEETEDCNSHDCRGKNLSQIFVLSLNFSYVLIFPLTDF